MFCDIVAEKHYGVPLIPAIITEYLSLFRILTRKFITGVQKMKKKKRKQDIAYMKRKFPQTEFTKLPDLGHGGLVLLKPEVFSEMICKLS